MAFLFKNEESSFLPSTELRGLLETNSSKEMTRAEHCRLNLQQWLQQPYAQHNHKVTPKGISSSPSKHLLEDCGWWRTSTSQAIAGPRGSAPRVGSLLPKFSIRTNGERKLARREANLSLSLEPLIFSAGTFRGQSISFSWLCRHPGARSLNSDVWSKGRRIPPSLPWMRAAFILRRAINARMCLSHPRNPPQPPLKFFSLEPPELSAAPPSPPTLSTMRIFYHPGRRCPHRLLHQDEPPAASAERQGTMVGLGVLFVRSVFFRDASYRTVSSIYVQRLPEASEQGSRSRLSLIHNFEAHY